MYERSVEKKKLIKARKLCNLLYFIDDLSAINDIYLEEIELCWENGNNAKKLFLI